MEAEADDTVATLKEAVAAKVDAQPSAIRLIYKGQILKDASTLESYGGCLLPGAGFYLVRWRGPGWQTWFVVLMLLLLVLGGCWHAWEALPAGTRAVR